MQIFWKLGSYSTSCCTKYQDEAILPLEGGNTPLVLEVPKTATDFLKGYLLPVAARADVTINVIDMENFEAITMLVTEVSWLDWWLIDLNKVEDTSDEKADRLFITGGLALETVPHCFCFLAKLHIEEETASPLKLYEGISFRG